MYGATFDRTVGISLQHHTTQKKRRWAWLVTSRELGSKVSSFGERPLFLKTEQEGAGDVAGNGRQYQQAAADVPLSGG